jgi:hypothetical protein
MWLLRNSRKKKRAALIGFFSILENHLVSKASAFFLEN